MDYFYIEKGIKPYMKKGSKTSDENAMKRLIRKGFEEARLILDIRGITKLRGNYLDVQKVDPDGRLRCSFNPVGTRFSRISSSENIFGTGTNLQNWPHHLLKYLLCDDGYIFYSLDLSQIENRIVAYVGRIQQMIEAFENGIDMHKLTAALIFNKPIDEVTTEDGTCPLGDGRKSERFWGKKSNHGLNYDEGYKTFSLNCEIPESQGKWIVDRFHAIYPGVRQNYHAGVRAQLHKNRTLTNLFGRKTLFLDRFCDTTYKAAYSCIPQGTCGDKINRQGVNFIYYNQQIFGPAELLIQIHDSVGFQVPLSTPWLKHAEMLLALKASLETPLVTAYDREFVVPVDLSMGFNLCKEDQMEIKHGHFPNNKNELAKLLEKNYQTLINK